MSDFNEKPSDEKLSDEKPALERSKTILIIEDDEGIREGFSMLLEFEGYTVLTASNGKEGLEVLHRGQRPCMIVLDLMMPVMNGLEFLEVVNQDSTLATIPVVLVTAFHDRTNLVKWPIQILKKPVDYDLLMSAVKKYCY